MATCTLQAHALAHLHADLCGASLPGLGSAPADLMHAQEVRWTSQILCCLALAEGAELAFVGADVCVVSAQHLKSLSLLRCCWGQLYSRALQGRLALQRQQFSDTGREYREQCVRLQEGCQVKLQRLPMCKRSNLHHSAVEAAARCVKCQKQTAVAHMFRLTP